MALGAWSCRMMERVLLTVGVLAAAIVPITSAPDGSAALAGGCDGPSSIGCRNGDDFDHSQWDWTLHPDPENTVAGLRYLLDVCGMHRRMGTGVSAPQYATAEACHAAGLQLGLGLAGGCCWDHEASHCFCAELQHDADLMRVVDSKLRLIAQSRFHTQSLHATDRHGPATDSDALQALVSRSHLHSGDGPRGDGSAPAQPKARDVGAVGDRDDALRRVGDPLVRLDDYFWSAPKPHLMDKWHHYFSIYHKYFDNVVVDAERGRLPVGGVEGVGSEPRAVRMLEIGVFKGGSLDMWRNYLGADAQLVGLDIDPATKGFERPPNTVVVVGDQTNATLLREVAARYGPFDIVLDDGGHTSQQQIASFNALFPLLNPGGVYAVEDICTSYWPEECFGSGGLHKPSTFVEFAKGLADETNIFYWHPPQLVLTASPHAAWIDSLHFHDNVVVFDKRRRPKYRPAHTQRGGPTNLG